MKFFSSFTILILAAVCAAVPTPAAPVAVPNANAGRMADTVPPIFHILKSRGSSTLDAPLAKRMDGNGQSCIGYSLVCSNQYDNRCCGGTSCQNGNYAGQPDYGCRPQVSHVLNMGLRYFYFYIPLVYNTG
ncbi:hypothetical protein FIBSPDRAFT_933076 [Athelia psychrophila]|uniref:Hydrophobin n=1 Tax=Athelia psychrophila TaxID=1759441 RepID=A0A166HMA7_9AGAM|nr:hypothetical protein FIBSPDRAFT_933076 [Fibularhizoctonia sp. CBS 109695]